MANTLSLLDLGLADRVGKTVADSADGTSPAGTPRAPISFRARPAG
jgi:hypothetical protein